MRILKQTRDYFWGTHKGREIEIVRDHDFPDRHFYIRVWDKTGLKDYDGYSPAGITTISQAKREAIKGACL